MRLLPFLVRSSSSGSAWLPRPRRMGSRGRAMSSSRPSQRGRPTPPPPPPAIARISPPPAEDAAPAGSEDASVPPPVAVADEAAAPAKAPAKKAVPPPTLPPPSPSRRSRPVSLPSPRASPRPPPRSPPPLPRRRLNPPDHRPPTSRARSSGYAAAWTLLVAAFGLKEKFDEEFLRTIFVANGQKRELARIACVLGFEDSLGDIFEELIKSGNVIETIYVAHEADLLERSPPVPLFKSYLRNATDKAQAVLKSGRHSSSALDIEACSKKIPGG